jgi:hypothetical protein
VKLRRTDIPLVVAGDFNLLRHVH